MKWLSIVRFVPDPGRGEFINIAAIAGDDISEETEMKAVSNWSRAKKLDDRGSLAAVMHFISDLQGRIEDSDGFFGRDDLERLGANLRNIVQLSPPIPVATSSLAAALDLAFEELIIDPSSRQWDFLTKRKAQSELRAAYKHRRVPFTKDASVRSGPYTTDFDFAVANGKALQLVRCWSFQLPNQEQLADELRAWAWGVRALRQNQHSQLSSESASVRVPTDVDVAAVFVPPKSEAGATLAFDVAAAAFKDVEVAVSLVSLEDADAVASTAESLLHPYT